MSESPDRCERYRINLDAKLATLVSDVARRRFCERELVRWEGLYDRWLENPSLMPWADDFDFSITLADIGKRLAQYAPVLTDAV